MLTVTFLNPEIHITFYSSIDSDIFLFFFILDDINEIKVHQFISKIVQKIPNSIIKYLLLENFLVKMI